MTPLLHASLTAAARLAAAAACLAVALLAASGCALRPPTDTALAERSVYVVQHGWHTGLVFRTIDLPADSPLRRAFPKADHVEAGWGDRGFYMAHEPGLWLGLRALLWPTPGVLHVVGLSRPPSLQFPEARIVQVGVSQAGLERMHERVRSSFEPQGRDDPRPLGPGLYAGGRFYASQEAFHAFRNCNVWTAQVLRAGGLAVTPGAALTARMLMGQVERHGAQADGQADPRPQAR